MGRTEAYVIVLHGGPGAPGQVDPVVRGLEDRFRVLAPVQRGSGGERLTVARHVGDLHDLVRQHSRDAPPALVGFSWGAMLALAWAAAHPEEAGPIALVGCGTFDPDSRGRMNATIDERMTDALRRRMDGLARELPDPDERLRATAQLLLPLYSYELASADLSAARCDARAHQETWDDMAQLQASGVYPAAFAAIDSPVLMLHGDADPHPGRMIRDSLAPLLRRLEYVELARCGHYPWLERHAHDQFFAVLREWLAHQLGGRT